MNKKPEIFKKANALYLNQMTYTEVWDFQKKVFQARKENKIDDTIIFVQHPHTITMGKSAHESNLLFSPTEYKDKNINIEYIDRGGDVTYHGPGQLVVYPILDLNQHFKDVHKYLRLLEDLVIDVLKNFNINAGRVEGLTGVWLGSEKICAIGVKVSRWITMHGIAININTDLTYFDYIIPCGIKDKKVTSLKKHLGQEVEIEKVIIFFLESFKKLFKLTANTTSYQSLMNEL